MIATNAVIRIMILTSIRLVILMVIKLIIIVTMMTTSIITDYDNDDNDNLV